MDFELRYPGRKEAEGKERSFRYICPESSGTLQKQKARFDPPGFTVVAYIPHKDRKSFLDAMDILSGSGHKFQAFAQLHFTILGLFAGELPEPFGPDCMGTLISAMDEFFKSKSIGGLQVEFDFLRPGIFVGQPGKSDGTVVAMASETFDATIVGFSKELAAYLAVMFPHYFAEARRRSLAGVWCSLGYFDEPDFAINQKVFETFTRLERFSAVVHVDEIAITEFTLKSLADGVVRGIVRL